MANAVTVSSLSFQFFNCLMGQLHCGALPLYRMTPNCSKPGQLLRIAGRS